MTSEEKLTMQDEPAPKSVPKSKELESKEEIEFKRSTVKRTKHLFLLFLRQFDVMEYEIVVRFLRVLLEKHRKEPIKIFEYLAGNKENVLAPLSARVPKIVKVQSLSSINENQAESNPKIDKPGPLEPKKEDDDACIFIDDDQILNKSDIIKSFAAVSDDNRESLGLITSAVAKKKDGLVSDLDESSSITSFGSSLDDYNYYNSRLFDDEESSQEGDGVEEFNCSHQNGHKSNGKSKRGRPSRQTLKQIEDVESELEKNFQSTVSWSVGLKRKLAKQLGLDDNQVDKWYAQRRKAEINKSTVNDEVGGHLNGTHDDQPAKRKGRGRPPKKRPASNIGSSDEVKNTPTVEPTGTVNGQIKEERTEENGNIQETEPTDQPNESPLGGDESSSSTSTRRRKSVIDKEPKQNETEKEVTTTRQGVRRRRQSTNDDSSAESSAKRACLRRGFPPSVVASLEKSFQSNNYPNDSDFARISDLTSLTEKQVKSWFSQRRHRLKNETEPAKSKRTGKYDEQDDDELEGGLEIDDDERSVASSTSDLASSSASTVSHGLDGGEIFSKQIESELEKSLKKCKRLDAQEKKTLVTKLGIKLTDLERWLALKKTKSTN